MVSTKNKVSIEKTWYNKSMLSDSEKQTIVRTATKYHAKRVVLFGSALSPDKESRDIAMGWKV
jgi:predicted nucleotidyltransferase